MCQNCKTYLLADHHVHLLQLSDASRVAVQHAVLALQNDHIAHHNGCAVEANTSPTCGQFHFAHQYLMAPEVKFVDHFVEQCKEFGDCILVGLLWFLGEWLDKNTQVFKAQIATFNTAQITIQDHVLLIALLHG